MKYAYKRHGSNQYVKKTNIHYVGYYIYTIALAIVFFGLLKSLQTPVILSPVANASTLQKVEALEKAPSQPEVKSLAEGEQSQIERYIKTIFGSDAKVAIAISHNECNPLNKLYPKCNLHTHVENSVGLFQINIESAVAKVHWARIPGETLEQKKEWLENPYNNTLLAYWIYQTSGWNPWSAYTSGNYLNDM